ncbi:MAG: hypothetical protein IT244_03695 [Bacteroidia bacterium]|nr:hypothetical protein [Bacteroidia bacterium]
MHWSKWCLLAFLFLLNTALCGQNSNVFGIEDSTLILRLLDEADAEKSESIQIKKASDAYIFSKNIGYERGKIRSLKLLISRHMAAGQNIEALRYCFSLIPVLEPLKSDDLPELYETTGDIYTLEGIYKKAIEYYEKSAGVGQGASKELLKKISNNALVDNDYNTALKYSLLLNEKSPSAELASQLGFCYQKLGMADEAVSSYRKAIAFNTANASLMENNLGFIEYNRGNIREAIGYFNSSVDHATNTDEKLKSLVNLSLAYQKNADYALGIATLEKCISLSQKENKQAHYQQLLANLYLNKGDVYSALTYSNLALENARLDKKTQAGAYLTRAQAYQNIYDFEGALSNYKLFLKLNNSLLLEEIAAQQSLTQKSVELQKMEKDLKESLLNDQIKFLNIPQLQWEGEKLKLNADKLMLEAAKRDAEIITLKREQEVKEERLKNIALENEKNRQKLALAAQELLNNNIKNKLEVLKEQEEKQRLELAANEAQEKQRLQQISLLEQDRKIGILEAEKQKTTVRNATLGGLLALALLVLAAFGFFYARNKNKILAKQNIDIENKNKLIAQSHEIIEADKVKSDELLLNILPEEVAQELKQHGASKPIHYDMVSILFTDFVSFTQYSERVSNETLINELNEIFHAFDEIIDEFNLEKIKTIGDSYMCAGGLPVPNVTNAEDAVNAAIKMRNYIAVFNKNRKEEDRLHIRIGINTGPCVAGVVGKRKFAYDIWGDSVNTAARMEQSSEAGKINVSENTYQVIKDKFHCEYRGMVEAKNKGKIKMYFTEMQAQRSHG